MITLIFGAPGAGKTSLNAHFLYDTYHNEGRSLLRSCKSRIAEINKDRKAPLSIPQAPPIFSDFKVRFLDGYDQYYQPFFLNGYYFGLANESMNTQFIPPGSKIFLSEGQRYFDSRRNATFPRWVSSAFEMHRHFMIDIWIDVQRPRLIDLNIRALCKRFIEVCGMDHDMEATGRITQTTFHCREFESLPALEEYLDTGGNNYRETTYVHRGNIFDCFDSYEHFKDFLPPDGKDFSLLPFPDKGASVDSVTKQFYDLSEPKGYRMKIEGKKGKDAI